MRSGGEVRIPYLYIAFTLGKWDRDGRECGTILGQFAGLAEECLAPIVIDTVPCICSFRHSLPCSLPHGLREGAGKTNAQAGKQDTGVVPHL